MIRVDSGQVASFATQLRDAPNILRPQLRKAVDKGTNLIVTDARRNAAWSKRIPGAIRSKTRFGARTAGAFINVSSATAPHARPFEGIQQRGDGTFRHPVFGRDVWVSEPTRPFLLPAVRGRRDEALRLIQDGINDTFRGRGT